MIAYEKGAWSGLVLDFSRVSVEKAMEMLQVVVPPGQKAPPTASATPRR
ncbi:MAG: hypothetical protein H7Z41_15885 [Cytophagales bacterium]|nr:hypothetical protein [Armatimonadota bacterium]